MKPKIIKCPYCGEHLGDLIKGKLFKFGKLQTEVHKCKTTCQKARMLAKKRRS